MINGECPACRRFACRCVATEPPPSAAGARRRVFASNLASRIPRVVHAPPLMALDLAVLLWLEEAPSTVMELVVGLPWDNDGVSQAVRRLRGRDLVHREQNAADKRVWTLSLTAKGWRVVRAAAAHKG